jgi:hypothetical protein
MPTSMGLSAWVEAADRQQLQAQVAELGQQAVQGRWSATGPVMVVWPDASVTSRPSNQADQRASRTPWTRSW